MSLRDADPAEVGGYRIEGRLGSGGMGVVYLARSASGRRLALKVVHGQYADDDEFRTRFRREVAAARRVSGAFTAPLVDADADAPHPWMATLYIPGENLGAYVRRNGPLPPEKVRALAAGLAEALRDIHRVGVVHRDLKPANVMLADDGPRVIDFGISRAADFAAADVLTQTGRVMGTPPFMSPEQFSSPHEVGPATDVFSLGAVVVYAASGHGPFDGVSPYEAALKVVEGNPDLRGVPAELLPLVALCLDKDPGSRPTADELLAFLRDGTRPVPRAAEEEPAVPERAARRRPGRRRALIAAVSVVLALAVAASVAAALRGTGRPGVPAALPAGWHAWHARAQGAEGAGSVFSRCAVAGTFLVCAGDNLKAVPFSLATGKQAWSRPVDSVTDGSVGNEGSVIGVHRRAVYVYGNEADRKGDHYSVQLMDTATARVLWRTPTGDGDAIAPDPDHGGAAAVPEGVLAVLGSGGTYSYGLLDADRGAVRWRHPMPRGHGACGVGAAGGRSYLLCWSEAGRTRISLLDPATGAARWTATAEGTLFLLGQDRGRLILAEEDMGTTYRTITTLDPDTHRVVRVPLARPQPAQAAVRLSAGALYFTLGNGSVRSVDPRTGRQDWENNSTLENPGPPLASGTRVYVASPNGRLAALDRHTGKVLATRPGRSDGGNVDATAGSAPLVLSGDALYVPYGFRSVYSVDVRHLQP
ncbi:protein kinase domain-containing protein [Streptomyces glomeratus]|uniref:Protein kinase domain-containing protein n=1 Tax=Streptomyces glomeratus TaxID=284452 RepID=A0ABP6M1C9_9ACTN|nr:serine/threonine-protein kinase [Streptomyces glomeratus]MCF1508962.1 serine/threonine-protein kinase [Streptomyces glomeratus]